MRKVTRAFRIFAALAAVALHAVASPGVHAAGAYTVGIGDATVIEADTANFTVTLNEPVQPGDVLTVEVESASGTATVGACPGDDAEDDFDTPLIFTGGERTKVVSVETCDDGLVEQTETFSVNLHTPEVVQCSSQEPGRCTFAISDPEGTGTINDDDEPGDLTVGSVSRAEGDAGTTPFNHTIRLTGPAPGPGQELTVSCTTPGSGTATEGVDYTPVSEEVTFGPGQRTATFSVPVSGDDDFEPNETYDVECSDPRSTGTPDDPRRRAADVRGQQRCRNDLERRRRPDPDTDDGAARIHHQHQ